MHSLPLFVRLAGRPVILLGDGEAAAAKRRLLERAGADVRSDESSPAALAIIALDGDAADGDAAAAAAARLKARGILVNVVDRPALCDFTLPAIIDRDPVLIAIGTGGASAGLAKALRQRLETLLPPSLGAIALHLQSLRGALRARFADPRDRRVAVDRMIAAIDILNPPAALEAQLSLDAPAVHPQGRCEVISLSSADPDELTLRAARLLGAADAVWHRGDVPDAILDRARADAQRHLADTPPPPPAAGLLVWLAFAS